VTPIFYFIGLPCNPLCAFIWLGRHTRRSNSSAIYLGALSISHTIFLILHIFSDLNYAWGIQTFDGHVSCELFFTLFYCPQVSLQC
jgi:G protein-coupled receptor 139